MIYDTMAGKPGRRIKNTNYYMVVLDERCWSSQLVTAFVTARPCFQPSEQREEPKILRLLNLLELVSSD